MASTFPWGDLPIALGELLRSGLSGVVEEVIAAVRAEVPEYDQPLEGEFGMLISQGVTVALEQFVGLLGRDEDMPDLVTSTRLGRAEHWAGRTLDALQSAYRVGARVAWRAMAQVGAAEGVESTTMYRLAEAIFAYIDRLAAASVAGFAEAEAMHVGALQARRHALLELLASATPPDRAEVDRRAEAAGLSPAPRRSRRSLSVADPAQLARGMPSGSIGAALDPVGVVLIPDPDGPGRPARVRAALRDRRAVLGPTVAWEDAVQSVRRALLRVAGARRGRARQGHAGPHRRSSAHAAPRCQPAVDRRPGRPSPQRAGGHDAGRPGARHRHPSCVAGCAWRRLSRCQDAPASSPDGGLPAQRPTRGPRRAALDDPKARLELALALQAAIAVTAVRPEPTTPPPRPTARMRPRPPPGKRIAGDLDQHLRVLPVKRSAGIGQRALADLAHARGELLVAVARHVREEVMLDLEGTGSLP